MGKCVRCGNEIDAISKDPSKVFYCKECSFEVLKRSSGNFKEMDEEEEIAVTGALFYYVFPGIFQMKNRRVLNSILMILSIVIFFYLMIKLKSKDREFQILIYINTAAVYLKNYFDIKRSNLE